MAHPGAVTGTCKYEREPHLASAYCESWEATNPVRVSSADQTEILTAVDASGDRDAMGVRMDASLAVEMIGRIEADAIAAVRQRDDAERTLAAIQAVVNEQPYSETLTEAEAFTRLERIGMLLAVSEARAEEDEDNA